MTGPELTAKDTRNMNGTTVSTNSTICSSIASIPDALEKWRTDHSSSYAAFSRMFDVTEDHGHLAMTPQVQANMLAMFKATDANILESLTHQRLVMIHNLWTNEGAVYNPLRGKRPGISPDTCKEKQRIDEVTNKSAESCAFCNFESFTAHDVIGRLENEHAVTVANAFRYDGVHSMVLLRTHDPVQWTVEQIVCMFDLGTIWFEKMKTVAPDNVYPMILWDNLPTAGVSQVHPHMHVSVSKKRYFGMLESWHQASIHYQQTHPKHDFFTDIVDIHDRLGLSVKHGKATAFASITPRKDHEVVIICDTGSQEFYELIYHVVKVFLDDLGQAAFSAAVVLPHWNADSSSNVPAFARLVPRGLLSTDRSDLSSLELFAMPSIVADGYALIHSLQKKLSKNDSLNQTKNT